MPKHVKYIFCFLALFIFSVRVSSSESLIYLPQDIYTFFEEGTDDLEVISTAEFDEYFFASVKAKNETNYIYGFKKDNNKWANWLITNVSFPQGSHSTKVLLNNITGFNAMNTGDTYTTPTLGIILANELYYEKYLSFSLENDIWELVHYWSQGNNEYFSIHLSDNDIVYYASIEDRKPIGILQVTIQRDIRYFCLETFPTTLHEAQNMFYP